MTKNSGSPTFLAGVAQVEITPQPGIDLTGYIAREGPSIGVHDPLFAAALVFEDGRQSAALVSCDLVGLDGTTVASVRQKIQSATGIPAGNVMLACTHTHSGPATIFVQDCGQVDPAYLAVLEDRLVEAARRASSVVQPVQVGAGSSELHGWAYDRRRQGTTIDPQVGVIGLRDLAGKPLAVLVNYACHPVVLEPDNRLISADYPGTLKQSLQATLGAPVLFLTGAPGDVDPVQRGSFEAAQAFGQALSGEALGVLEELSFSASARLAVESITLDLPLGEAPGEEELRGLIAGYQERLQELEAIQPAGGAIDQEADRLKPRIRADALETRVTGAMLHWAQRTLGRVLRGQAETSVPFEVQALRLGPAAVVGVAGELFSELGQAIKKGIPGNSGLPDPSPGRTPGDPSSGQGAGARTVLVSAYTNGDVGYIPTQTAYARGGYEIAEAYRYYGYPAALRPEAGERVVGAARRILEDLQGNAGIWPGHREG